VELIYPLYGVKTPTSSPSSRCICRVGSNGAVDATDGPLLEELAIHTVSEGIREETAASTPKELARDGTNSRGESSCLPAGNCYPRCQRKDKPFCLKVDLFAHSN